MQYLAQSKYAIDISCYYYSYRLLLHIILLRKGRILQMIQEFFQTVGWDTLDYKKRA